MPPCRPSKGRDYIQSISLLISDLFELHYPTASTQLVAVAAPVFLVLQQQHAGGGPSAAQKAAKPFLTSEPAGMTRRTLNLTVLDSGLPKAQVLSMLICVQLASNDATFC